MTRKQATLGEDLRVPAIELQTQTLVVYGGKGMGKTNLGAVVAEELAAHGLRFAWLDPVGVAWGLKHSSDGKGAGVEALVLGGIHGDIPITPTSGEVIADLVVDEGVSVIVDISRHHDGKMWGAGEKIRFVRDYCARLFQRQGEQRRPLLQIIDEAGRFVPQQMPKGAIDIAECVGSIEQLVELGRNVGVGVMLITQRSARMNKSVSELAEMMVAFRTVGPNSIDAIMDWFGDHVPKARQRELVERVRQLPRGTALVVSPGWLGIEGEYEIRRRQTFDSSDTPRAGEERRVRGRGAQVDVNKYRARMADVEKAAEANDPRVLTKRIASLERELKEAARSLESLESERAKPRERERVEVPMVPKGIPERLDKLCSELETALATMADIVRDVVALRWQIDDVRKIDVTAAGKMGATAVRVSAPGPTATSERPSRPGGRPDSNIGREISTTDVIPPERSSNGQARGSPSSSEGTKGEALPAGERRVLIAIAQHGSVTREQLTVLTGYKRATRNTYIQRLRERGFCDIANDGRVYVTDPGVDALGGDYQPLPIGKALLEHWLRELPEGERKVLSAIANAYPEAVERELITDLTDYKRATRNTYIQRLRARELVGVRGTAVVASDVLFEED